MSVHITSAVWDHSQASGAALTVLLSLADQANDDGTCWPSLANIAKRCRISERSAQRHIQTLISDLEELRKDDRQGQSSVFTVLLGRRSEGGDNLSPRGRQSVTLPTTLLSPTHDTAVTQKHQETSREPNTYESDDSHELGGLLSFPAKDRSTDEGATFEQWYATYPKHVAVAAARKSYKAALKKVDAATLQAGAEAVAAQYPDRKAPEFQYCPMPSTWLNQERWADERSNVSRADKAWAEEW